MKYSIPQGFVPVPGTESSNEPKAGPVYYLDTNSNYEVIRMRRSARSLERHQTPWKRLRCAKGKYGHRYVKITYTGGKTVSQTIHTLVLEVIKGQPRPAGMVCRHLDGNPSNNHPDNLKWGTSKENAADTQRHGRGPAARRRTQNSK